MNLQVLWLPVNALLLSVMAALSSQSAGWNPEIEDEKDICLLEKMAARWVRMRVPKEKCVGSLQTCEFNSINNWGQKTHKVQQVFHDQSVKVVLDQIRTWSL